MQNFLGLRLASRNVDLLSGVFVFSGQLSSKEKQLFPTSLNWVCRILYLLNLVLDPQKFHVIKWRSLTVNLSHKTIHIKKDTKSLGKRFFKRKARNNLKKNVWLLKLFGTLVLIRRENFQWKWPHCQSSRLTCFN